jgi:DNA-binding NarL/FixJ family response regulator
MDSTLIRCPTCHQILHSPLTTRQIEVLCHVAHGDTNKQIASELKISDQTVKNHMAWAMGKLGADNRTAAVVAALRTGQLEMRSTSPPDSA